MEVTDDVIEFLEEMEVEEAVGEVKKVANGLRNVQKFAVAGRQVVRCRCSFDAKGKPDRRNCPIHGPKPRF